uniref:RING-type domain-containing protein n=1 Tax=Caenorhabditis tropicalis TaxID=1561998 RepID=A0A1I7UYI6_9PELO
MHSFKSSTLVQPFIRTPSCQVCLEPYDGKHHIPKILQCAHTVCESCVNVLEEQSRQNSANRNLNQPIVNICCPVCRATTQAPRNCIRTNYQLIDVVDGLRGEENHNVVFVSCTGCQGVYHEKDINICTKCSPIKKTTTAAELLDNKTDLSSYGVCSTCLMIEHMAKGHFFVGLQPLRVAMQRQENLRQIMTIQSNLHRTQYSFRERLNLTMVKWISWSSKHETLIELFKEATDSFTQKKVYDEFVKHMTKKTERTEHLMKSVQQWSDELENEMKSPVPQEERANTPMDPFDAAYLHYFGE